MSGFGSLWVGKPLTKIEVLCLSSFVYHGHELNLFVYDMNLSVPEGILKHDARQIIDESEIFKVYNSYGPIADKFRYKMIQRTGLTWTDTDNICLKGGWDFPEYLFGMQGGPEKIVANGLLRAPKNSEFISELVETSSTFNKNKITWGEIGPNLVTPKIYKYNLGGYIQNPDVFYPINYWEWSWIFSADHKEIVFEKSKNSYTLQIWNQMLNRKRFNKDGFYKNSAIDFYYNKYVEKQ